MIDIQQEKLLSFPQACTFLAESTGKRLHPSTVFRWCNSGVRGVRLDYVRVGRAMLTSSEALGRFIRQLTEADIQRRDKGQGLPICQDPIKRRESHETAEAELDREGIK